MLTRSIVGIMFGSPNLRLYANKKTNIMKIQSLCILLASSLSVLLNFQGFSQENPAGLGNPVEIEYFNPSLDAVCANGSIVITVNNGEDPFDYELINSETNEAVDLEIEEVFGDSFPIGITISNLTIGDYLLTVTDSNCKFVEFDVSLICECPELTYNQTPITCESPGNIEFIIPPEMSNVIPDNVGWTDLDDYNGLDREFTLPGQYEFYWSYVGCEISGVVDVSGVEHLGQPTLIIHRNNENCQELECEGLLMIDPQTEGDFEYTISEISGNSDNTFVSSFFLGYIIIDQLCNGTYLVEISNNDCSLEMEYEICCCNDEACGINLDFEPEFEITYPSSTVSNDGSICITNIESNVLILWEGGVEDSYGNCIQNISVGEYTYSINTGCDEQIEGSVSLEACTELTIEDIDYLIADDCDGNGVGSITILNEGVSFEWFDGSTGNSVSGLNANTNDDPYYTVTIDGLQGCPAQEFQFVIDEGPSDININVLSTTPACPGQSNGTITIQNLGPHNVALFSFVFELITINAGETLTLEGHIIAGSWEFVAIDACGEHETIEYTIEEIEDSFEVTINDHTDINGNGTCGYDVEFYLPAGSHIVFTECDDIIDYVAVNGGTILRSVDFNACDFSYSITTPAGCTYEDLVEAPSFSFTGEVDIEHICRKVDDVTIFFNNDTECIFEGLYDGAGNRYKLINIQTGNSPLAHEVGENYIKWLSGVQDGEYLLEFELCCGLIVSETYIIEDEELDFDDLTFVGLEQTGDNRYDQSCIYTQYGCSAVPTVLDPTFIEMDWSGSDVTGDNCCGSMLYYCPDVEEPLSVGINPVTMTRWEATILKIDSGIQCDNCPDWNSEDYLDEYNIDACDRVKICPNRICCDIPVPSPSIWVGDSGGESLIDNCRIIECGILWWSETYSSCEICENEIPSNIITGDIGCHGPAVETPEITESGCEEEEEDNTNIECEMDGCERKKMNFGWFHHYMNDIDTDYPDFYESQLYEWYNGSGSIHDGWFYQTLNQRWCIEFFYCYCPDAEPSDRYSFLAWDPDNHPDDYQEDFDCYSFNPDSPNMTPINEECELNVHCLRDDGSCEEGGNFLGPQVNSLDCYDVVDDPLGDGVVKNNIKDDDTQYLNCQANEFVRLLPYTFRGVENYTAAINNNEEILENYSYHINELILDPNFSIEFQHYNWDEFFYITRPLSDKESNTEYIFNFEHDEHNWLSTSFNASEELSLDGLIYQDSSSIKVSGHYSGELIYSTNTIAESKTKTPFSLTFNLFDGSLLDFNSYGDMEISQFDGGLYYTKSSKYLEVNPDLDVSTANEGDGVIILDDRSSIVLPSDGQEPIKIIDIYRDKNNIEVVYMQPSDERNNQIMLASFDGSQTDIRQIARGELDITSLDVHNSNYYLAINLNGDAEIAGKTFRSLANQEILVAKLDENGSLLFANQYSGDGIINVKQLEHNGSYIYLGGDVSLNSGEIDFGTVRLANPYNCPKSAYVVHILDAPKVEDLKNSNNRSNYDSTDQNISESDLVSIFPNPTTKLLTIAFNEPLHQDGGRIEVLSSANTLVDVVTVVNRREVIDLSQYAPGVYFIRVILPDGRTEINKIIKL